MSLKLKGIKAIANKLKQTKRDKGREKQAWEANAMEIGPETARSAKKHQLAAGFAARATTKASVLDTAYETPTPRTRRKQHRQSSDMSMMSRFDSMDLMTPISLAESAPPTPTVSKENDSVKVFVRIRPPSAKELKEENQMSLYKTSDASLQLKTPDGVKNYAFDAVVGDDVSQDTLFQSLAAPIVERCLLGYNGCIFAYGQTGSGKTYTMLGDASMTDHQLHPSAGIIPRTFQYLFELLQHKQQEMPGKIEIECRCSFLEIYNEGITDLLDPTKTNLQIREDKSGTHAAGLTEIAVTSVDEVVALMRVGAAHRKVAHTKMNAESSRSHSLLSCIVTTRRHSEHGVISVFKSRLNLVDLAGSERQRGTGSTGTRLKEASSINKSLSTLGLVIMSLGDAKGKKTKHIPYRDSKLTFLLQDSLGGNANAVMISNVSPATKNIHETLSTLRFARGAKRVKNKAVANHDCVGDISTLKAEIALLKQELAVLREKALMTQELDEEHEMEIENVADEGQGKQECIVPVDDVALFEDNTQQFGLDKTLASALRREDNAHRTVVALSEEVLLLHSALEIKRSEMRQYKLLGKLKDDKIQRLENMVKQQNRAACEDDLELHRLKEEVEFFKEKASRIPDATKYAIENMQLKHELSTLKWSLECNNSKERFDAQIAELREKLLQLNAELAHNRSLESDDNREQEAESKIASAIHIPTTSTRMQRIFGRFKKKDHDEVISRYFGHLAKLAENVMGFITKPLSKMKLRLRKQKTAAFSDNEKCVTKKGKRE